MLSPAAEFGAGDSGGDGYIQAIGSWTLVEIRNQQLVGNTFAYGIADAITLVAHYNQSLLRQLLCVDVLSVQEGAVNGEILR